MSSPILDMDIEAPTARKLAEAITEAVRAGRLTQGDRLPPIREVARQLKISATTVSAAWSLLNQAGTITTARRRGTTIAAPSSGRRYRRSFDPASRFPIDVSHGEPDPALLPDLATALAAMSPRFPGPGFLDQPVLPELEHVLRQEWPYEAESMTVVNGVINGLELTTRVAVPAGAHVVVEDPCFPPLLDLLDDRRIAVTGVQLDAEGMIPAALDRALRRPTAAIYLQPQGQNPTGITMSPARARRLADLAVRSRALVIEDAAGAASSCGTPSSLGRWIPGQTVHIRNFSKSHGVEVRVAALSGPGELIDRVTSLRQIGQGWTSRILQRLLYTLVTDTQSQRVVERAREHYRERRAALVGHLAAEGINVAGTDGYNVWVPVADESAAMMQAARHGVGVAHGAPFTIAAGRSHVRVTTSRLSGEDLRRVAVTLAHAARSSSWIRA
jgi:DNA-binding transcriptional MocR family regulator